MCKDETFGSSECLSEKEEEEENARRGIYDPLLVLLHLEIQNFM